MKVGIIGCGRFGSCLATILAKRGAEVLAMDKDPAVVGRLSSIVTRMVEGDATDEETVREAGFGECDAVVIAIGANVEGSLLAAMSLKQMNVARVYAKAVTDLHGKVLDRIGVSMVLYPDRDMAARVAQLLWAPSILDYVEVSSEAGVIAVKAPRRIEGKTIMQSDLKKEYGVVVLAIEKMDRQGNRKRTILVPGPDDVVEKNDVVVLFGPNKRLRQIQSDLAG